MQQIAIQTCHIPAAKTSKVLRNYCVVADMSAAGPISSMMHLFADISLDRSQALGAAREGLSLPRPVDVTA
ncbi:hypothetical protein PsYK624_127240 [Phanerochaete sordida]|uniref:Uncharacterized protein n=1 Tax=Phanerochaete sordida TaxID=48140 RepID=A0A9P3GJV5_9APHY|nr:hypothetical protein PsYK624_127240 [Phanerochaete sordida]